MTEVLLGNIGVLCALGDIGVLDAVGDVGAFGAIYIGDVGVFRSF